jgi:hypothetical protein
MISLKKEQLAELLEQAYQSGWYGTLELKESVVKDMLKKAEDMSPVNFSSLSSNSFTGGGNGLNDLNSFPSYNQSFANSYFSIEGSQLSHQQDSNQLTLTGLDFGNTNHTTIVISTDDLDNRTDNRG